MILKGGLWEKVIHPLICVKESGNSKMNVFILSTIINIHLYSDKCFMIRVFQSRFNLRYFNKGFKGGKLLLPPKS